VILVVGATGVVGSEVCRLLTGHDHDVRALVRPTSGPERVAALRSLGAELVEGDLKEPETLESACAGADAVISTATMTTSSQDDDTIEAVDRDGQLALVDAAEKAGIRRFVFMSFPPFAVDFPLQSAKLAVERRLAQSGMEHVCVRPAAFSDVWLSPRLGFDPLGGEVQIFGSGEQKVSWVSLHDVARLTADVVDSPAARNRLIDFGGPEALSHHQVVEIFEEETGRPIRRTHVPVEALEAQVAAAEDSLQASFAGLMLAMGTEGQRVDLEPVLRDFPRELRSVRDYARSLVAAAQASP
jgi:NADH dehydrogenase